MGSLLKRWGPLAGAAVLVSGVVLRLFGLGEVAGQVEGFAGLLGLTAQSPVTGAEVAAAAAALTGIVLKIRAEINKAAKP